MAIHLFSNAIEADEPNLFDVQPNRKEYLTIADAFHYFMDQIYDGAPDAGIGSWHIAELKDGSYLPIREQDADEDVKQLIRFEFGPDYNTRFFDEKDNLILDLPEGQ